MQSPPIQIEWVQPRSTDYSTFIQLRNCKVIIKYKIIDSDSFSAASKHVSIANVVVFFCSLPSCTCHSSVLLFGAGARVINKRNQYYVKRMKKYKDFCSFVFWFYLCFWAQTWGITVIRSVVKRCAMIYVNDYILLVLNAPKIHFQLFNFSKYLLLKIITVPFVVSYTSEQKKNTRRKK